MLRPLPTCLGLKQILQHHALPPETRHHRTFPPWSSPHILDLCITWASCRAPAELGTSFRPLRLHRRPRRRHIISNIIAMTHPPSSCLRMDCFTTLICSKVRTTFSLPSGHGLAPQGKRLQDSRDRKSNYIINDIRITSSIPLFFFSPTLRVVIPIHQSALMIRHTLVSLLSKSVGSLPQCCLIILASVKDRDHVEPVANPDPEHLHLASHALSALEASIPDGKRSEPACLLFYVFMMRFR